MDVGVFVGGAGVRVNVGVPVARGVRVGPLVDVGVEVRVGVREGASTCVDVTNASGGYSSRMAAYQSRPLVNVNSVKRAPA